jgi:hypothetical protein
MSAAWKEYAKKNEVYDHKGWYDNAFLQKFNIKPKK